MLNEVENDTNIENVDDDEEEYTYSLWKATMVKNPKSKINQTPEEVQVEGNEISLRNQNTEIVSASANFYLQSTWKGLEQKIGETEVEKATVGLSGIPKNYKSEPNK